MDTKQVFCARSSSADSLNIRIGTEIAEGYCPRCDKSFRATPCQECGGFRVDGSYGVSGARFERLPDTVKCWDCGHRNPLRDPGPD